VCLDGGRISVKISFFKLVIENSIRLVTSQKIWEHYYFLLFQENKVLWISQPILVWMKKETAIIDFENIIRKISSRRFSLLGSLNESISSAALHRAAQHVDRWIFSWFESTQISKWSNGSRTVQRGTVQQRNRTLTEYPDSFSLFYKLYLDKPLVRTIILLFLELPKKSKLNWGISRSSDFKGKMSF
jgi:hypothetical protein